MRLTEVVDRGSLHISRGNGLQCLTGSLMTTITSTSSKLTNPVVTVSTYPAVYSQPVYRALISQGFTFNVAFLSGHTKTSNNLISKTVRLPEVGGQVRNLGKLNTNFIRCTDDRSQVARSAASGIFISMYCTQVTHCLGTAAKCRFQP